jgi:predicted DNA-binding protein with PD1-like motif
MNVIESKGPPGLVAIGLGPDEKLLESIQAVIKSHHIREGAVVSGIGTLKRCHMHYVNTTTFPAENRFYVVEEPLEIGSISGLIADYEPHLHMTAGCRDQKTYTGHVEPGCVVLYLTEVLIIRLDGMKLGRELDRKRGVSLLVERR